MTESLTQFTITEAATGYWRVTFNNPPINLSDTDTLLELQRVVGLIESDDTLRVVVFDSADPDFFINHYDVSRFAEFPLAPGPTGLPTFIDTTTRLATSPVVTIASIRGRTRGGGSEIALACDMRFASLERAIFAQIEVGAGVFPGGGGIERLPLLVGRARALEIVLGSDDFDAATAENYGWVNRAFPDDELDAYVDNLARRIASFDKPALAEAKRLINRNTLPSAEDLVQTQDAFLDAFSWPTVQQRGARIRRRAGEVGPDFEARFGHHLGELGGDAN
ncbi:enoyl-CoA hydratase/isomerase family protein [Nocardia vinacea]|uniref:enoyl-CoA hydratase/isomerase family protein n=1 Tax=Nocardia vinacea TaxID=96468 RepID=UPI002E165FA2|nr:enoyl-CoA hydratase/isomerase family protein [Nocardia vinacea]